MRKVLVFSTKSNSTQTVETSASNWGELSQYLTAKGLFSPGTMKAIVRETGSTVELAEASIPDNDFTLLLIPTKNDSGANVDSEELKEYINKLLDEFQEKLEEYIDAHSTLTEYEDLVQVAQRIRKELGL